MKEKRVAFGNGRKDEVQDMARDILGTGMSQGLGYQAGPGRDNRLYVAEGYGWMLQRS